MYFIPIEFNELSPLNYLSHSILTDIELLRVWVFKKMSKIIGCINLIKNSIQFYEV